jgi:membrane protein implicated in regulation of membrane protease activity
VRRAPEPRRLPLAVVPAAVVPVVVTLVLIPPAWQALVLTVVMVPLLPWLVLRIVERVEKRSASTAARFGGHVRSDPTDPT